MRYKRGMFKMMPDVCTCRRYLAALWVPLVVWHGIAWPASSLAKPPASRERATVPLSPSRVGWAAQPGIPRTCADLEGVEWGRGVGRLGQVVLEVPDLLPEWGDRSPRLCLMDDPVLDSQYAILLQLFRNLDEFRSAKAAAVGHLVGAGFDPCQVYLWEPLALGGVLEEADLYDLPAEFQC